MKTPESADDPEVVREMALRHLDRRAYGIAELSAVLVRKGANSEVVDDVLARLAAVGLLDDQAYADGLVETKHEARHMSRRAVALDLTRRGLSSEVVAAATADLDDESDWAGAREVAARQAHRLVGLDNATAWRRLAGALARKGYGPAVVSGVVREMLNNTHQEVPND